MLRVTICNSPGESRLHLEGRLTGPWVMEAEACWKTMQSTPGDRALIVDLRDVDFVDSAGEQLLCLMHRQGARLVAASPMMAHLVGEIAGAGAGGKRGAAVPVCYRKKKY
jgi:ABC-type transporter Mla MlaB component